MCFVDLVAVVPQGVDGVRERGLDEAEALGRGLLTAGEVDDDGAAPYSSRQPFKESFHPRPTIFNYRMAVAHMVTDMGWAYLGLGLNLIGIFHHISLLANLHSVSVQGDSSGQTPAFVDFDFRSSAVLPRYYASSATLAAAQAELGNGRSSEITVNKS